MNALDNLSPGNPERNISAARSYDGGSDSSHQTPWMFRSLMVCSRPGTALVAEGG